MSGKILVGIIVAVSVIVGAAMYYVQVYAYYERVGAPANGVELTTLDGALEPITISDYQGIDADSSPIRFRACFNTPQSPATLGETYQVYEGAEPLIAPGWFDCFDAQAIENDLLAGDAIAFLGQKNFAYGVDRVVVVNNEGRGFIWHQLNDCGETDYTGTPVGEACPDLEQEGN